MRVRLSAIWIGAVLGATPLIAALFFVVGAAKVPASPTTTAAVTPVVSAEPVSPPYPYANSSRVGPWGFTTCHDTDYIAWRFFDRDVSFAKSMTGPNGKTVTFGDPGTWATSAAGVGFTVDGVARAGAIAQWQGGEDGATAAGHVAYVDRVNADGSVVLSEFDWTVKHGYSQRGEAGQAPVRAPRYIHIKDL